MWIIPLAASAQNTTSCARERKSVTRSAMPSSARPITSATTISSTKPAIIDEPLIAGKPVAEKWTIATGPRANRMVFSADPSGEGIM